MSNGNGVLKSILKPDVQLPALVTPRRESSVLIVEPPRLTASPFQIDHRGEVLKEHVHDADILDQQAAALITQAETEAAALLDKAHKQAAALTHTAYCLRIAHDHLNANPPDEP